MNYDDWKTTEPTFRDYDKERLEYEQDQELKLDEERDDKQQRGTNETIE